MCTYMFPLRVLCFNGTGEFYELSILWEQHGDAVCLCWFSPDAPDSSPSSETCRMGVRLIEDSKLTLGVNVSVTVCLHMSAL